MMQPDLEGAKQYALERLARELAPHLVYHSVGHTRDDVVLAVERLAALLRIGGEALLLMQTAAYYHDIGFIERRWEHETIGVHIVKEALPAFGYSLAQVAAIGGMIMATRMPQSPRTSLEKLVADADLDVLGRVDFLPRNQALYRELTAEGLRMTPAEWSQSQMEFVQHHAYWTQAARSLRDSQKEQNVQALQALLTRMHAS